MTASRSDALVFFGATGDLAYKKIFPALQALIQRGHLDMPVVGVAKSNWTLDQFKARAKDSLEKHGRPGPGGVCEALLLVALCRRGLWRPDNVCEATEGPWRRQTAAVLPGHPT